MSKLRTPINVAVFMLASVVLVVFGIRHFIAQDSGDYRLAAMFEDASGLKPRNDVTMRGVVVGSVVEVELTDTAARVEMQLEPGTEAREGTRALIVRRSPIGELTVELEPGEGPVLDSGSVIAVADTQGPPDVSKTFELMADILHAVPAEDLDTVVSELSAALEGRAADLARFSEDAADLPERLLEVSTELERLIRTGPKVTGVFADNADVFADDIRQTALLADILRDRRFDLVELSSNGTTFLREFGELLREQKPNIACFLRDAGKVNLEIAKRRDMLATVIETNHFFFNAAEQAVQKDARGHTWFRVQLLPHTEPQGRSYTPKRAYPDGLPGFACNSMYGPGVDRPLQGVGVTPPDSEIRK